MNYDNEEFDHSDLYNKLEDAIQSERIDLIEDMLEFDFSLNFYNSDETLLDLAVLHPNENGLKMVIMLLKNGALPINQSDFQGGNALLTLLSQDPQKFEGEKYISKITQELIDYDVDIDDFYSDELTIGALYLCYKNRHTKALAVLINNGINLDNVWGGNDLWGEEGQKFKSFRDFIENNDMKTEYFISVKNIVDRILSKAGVSKKF